MLCPPINHTIPYYQQYEIHDFKMPNHLPKFQQVSNLQRRAYTDLCELSDTICQQQCIQREEKHCLSRQTHQFSPWTLKMQENYLEQGVGRSKSKNGIKNQTQGKMMKQQNRCYSRQNKENVNITTEQYKQQMSIKKYPSIFLRLMAAKEIRGGSKNKKEDPQIELITCMKRRKSLVVGDLQAVQSEIKLSKMDVIETWKRAGEKQKLNERRRRKSLSKLTMKHLHHNLMQAECSDNQKGKIKQAGVQLQHWKTKSNKNKLTKKLSKIQKQNKNIQDKQSKQNLSLSKKGSRSLQKGKRIQYQSSNPLTRLLYEKYVNTVNLSNVSKETKCKFL